MHLFDVLMAYEQGELDLEGELALYRELVSTGLLWGLQGHYQRTYYALVDDGLLDDES